MNEYDDEIEQISEKDNLDDYGDSDLDRFDNDSNDLDKENDEIDGVI